MEERKIIINEITLEELTEKIAEKLLPKLTSYIENSKAEEESFLTRKETAEYLKVSLTTLWNWSKSGKLKSYGLGSRVYYKQTEIDEKLERNKL